MALFRPGPLQSGMVHDFIDAQARPRARSSYPHPALEPVLAPTYGVIVYQEQVMQIAQVLAGYSLGGADLLRRAMGKKKAEEMAKQRVKFVDGATERGVDAAQRRRTIFDLMEKFAGYGFNKSHSAAYALLSYQTAWLKAHYPAAVHGRGAVRRTWTTPTRSWRSSTRRARMGSTVLPPDVNASHYMFEASIGDDHPLRPRRDEGRRPAARARRSPRSARRDGAFATCSNSAGASIRRSSTAARWKR